MVPSRNVSIPVLGILLLNVLAAGAMTLNAQAPSQDPVLKARAERAAAQGIGEGDLPPLPKGVVEPPPLPPPETHVKDTRGGRLAKSRKHPASKSAAKARKHTPKGGPTTKKKRKA